MYIYGLGEESDQHIVKYKFIYSLSLWGCWMPSQTGLIYLFWPKIVFKCLTPSWWSQMFLALNWLKPFQAFPLIAWTFQKENNSHLKFKGTQKLLWDKGHEGWEKHLWKWPPQFARAVTAGARRGSWENMWALLEVCGFSPKGRWWQFLTGDAGPDIWETSFGFASPCPHSRSALIQKCPAWERLLFIFIFLTSSA